MVFDVLLRHSIFVRGQLRTLYAHLPAVAVAGVKWRSFLAAKLFGQCLRALGEDYQGVSCDGVSVITGKVWRLV